MMAHIYHPTVSGTAQGEGQGVVREKMVLE